ncbi:MAG TPA: glycoside hydrolase family 3 N-terminal domain-containing protein [Terriglobia bacterium]|nr:glycoside hydrolase family 3 N-terminal domain-containing protein [Terriglobia bacterium]
MTRREFASTLTGAGILVSKLGTESGEASEGMEQKNGEGAPGPASDAGVDYRNPKLPIEQRTADLLSRMTLEEKVEQLRGGKTSSYGILDTTGKFTEKDIRGNFRQIYDMHSRRSPHDQAVYRNALQRYAVEKTRLGIPQIFQDEALHGYTAENATSFPQAIALGSTWDPDLVQRVFTATGDEAASAGINQVFAPVINLARDPRWGRTEETYGEDPYLCARIGVAAIKGLQSGNFMIDRHHVLATAKHFAALGESYGGRNTAPANWSERDLREVFLVPFRAAVQEAQVGSVMAAYNEINGGIPCHINTWLLGHILHGEWGFRGYVTSDGAGLEMLVDKHHVATDFAGAAPMALAAGLDYDRSGGAVYVNLLDQVRAGKVPESQIDRAVSCILATKFRLGLFDNPYVDPDYAQRITNCEEHRKLALETAQKSIVLLKNEGNLLPLDLKKLKTIAVIGPDAGDAHLGGYSRPPASGDVSLLQGIRERAGSSVQVVYAQGCKITTGTRGNVTLPNPNAQVESIRAATEVARKADVAILVVGGNEATCHEASDRNPGDRDSLDMAGMQDQLIQSVVDTETPTVVFLINGRPLSINYAAEHVPAILEGWYLGQEGGTAAAQVLFGDVNPGGKLTITFPRSVGDLPAYYYHKPSAEVPYLFEKPGPLFPFGHGLSYTTFKFSNLKLSHSQIAPEGETTVSVDVINTGSREGDEVAQLYIRDRVSSVTRPVKELKGFRRVHLKPGGTETVQFKLTPAELGFYNVDMHWVVEPGTFDIMVGSSSVETISTSLEVV